MNVRDKNIRTLDGPPIGNFQIVQFFSERSESLVKKLFGVAQDGVGSSGRRR